MVLYHVSPSKNDAGIRSYGILASCSRCKEEVVWLVERSQLEWAIEHVRERHQVADVTVWMVDVPRRRVQRRGHGPFVHVGTIQPSRVRGKLSVLSDGTVLTR